jgi:pimeloyl-ACP methyl ester carboxylesterase
MSGRVHRFARGAYTFEVNDRGPIDGEIVVLLHGFPQTARSWDAVCERLHRRGCRTLSFDQRGYAPNARPRGRSAYRVGALAGDVVALVNAAGGQPVHLVGHDWGAMVAWVTASRFPSIVSTLTTVSVPHPRAFLRSMLFSDQAARSYYIALIQVPGLIESLARLYPKAARSVLRAYGMSDEQLDRVRSDVVDTGAFVGGLNWYRAIPFAHPANLAPVQTPTTHVWSTGDIALSRYGAERCARYVKGPYRLEILNGTHWIPEEQPDRLSEIIAERIGPPGR